MAGCYYLFGDSTKNYVYNHPQYKDGTYVTLSQPKSFNPSLEILTNISGNKYFLGEPLKEYNDQFPNARERMIKILKDNYL